MKIDTYAELKKEYIASGSKDIFPLWDMKRRLAEIDVKEVDEEIEE